MVERTLMLAAALAAALPQHGAAAVAGAPVEWTLVTSSADPHGAAFKREFAPVAAMLAKHTRFSVVYAVGSGKLVGCKPWGPFGCEGQCTNGGRYCATDPDGDLTKGLDGRDVVAEDVRQLCIFQLARERERKRTRGGGGGGDGGGTARRQWWDYVVAHDRECELGHGLSWEAQCADNSAGDARRERMMRAAGIDPAAVRSCVTKSGGTRRDGPNALLDAQLAAQSELRTFTLPALLVQGKRFRGSLACPDFAHQASGGCAPLHAICAAFRAGEAPDVCAASPSSSPSSSPSPSLSPRPHTASATAPGPPPGAGAGAGAGSSSRSGSSAKARQNAPDPASLGLQPSPIEAQRAKAEIASEIARHNELDKKRAADYVPSESSQVALTVIRPPQLVAQFAKRFGAHRGITLRPALFGVPPYGGTVSGRLVQPESSNRDACKPVDAARAGWVPGTPSIAIVSRGGCRFEEKVRHLQAAGAEAVVVFDRVKQDYLYYMGAAGDTSDIVIPAVFLHRVDGIALLGAMCSGAPLDSFDGKMPDSAACRATPRPRDALPVWVKLAWSMPHPNDYVHWSVWTSSIGSGGFESNRSVAFERDFAPVAQALGDHAVLRVFYVTQSGISKGCAPHFGTRRCQDLCTNGGRYCAPDPDGDETVGLSGVDVVRENLRQLCVFQVATAAAQQHKWWRFVNDFNAACRPGTGGTWETRCKQPGTMNALMRGAGLDTAAVRACVRQSGGTEADAPNKLLDEQLRAQTDHQLWSTQVTTLAINGVKYRGNLRCLDADDPERCGPLEAICAGFAPASRPAVCGGGDSAVEYFGHAEARSWTDAHAACAAEGGRLARIRSARDNERVYAMCGANQQRCWIGLSDAEQEGQWTWTNGQSEGAFRMWAAGEPNNGGGGANAEEEDCAYIHGPGYAPGARRGSNWSAKRRQWGDRPCSQRMAFVCERDIDFVFNHQPLSWALSEQHCAAMGGHLASIHSFGDNEKVYGACAGARCWIGLNDRRRKGVFEWTAARGGNLPLDDGLGAGAGVSSFKRWAGGEPSNVLHPGTGSFTRTSGERQARAAGLQGGGGQDCVYVHGGRFADTEKRSRWGNGLCSERLPAVCAVPQRFHYHFTAYLIDGKEVPKMLDWASAEKECAAQYPGGHLADVQSFAENRRIFHLCVAQRCWIGLSDRQREGSFSWTDGTFLGTVGRLGFRGFVNWALGEPNNGGGGGASPENCVYMHGTRYETPFARQAQWGDRPCGEKMAFVCQSPRARVATAGPAPAPAPAHSATTKSASPSTGGILAASQTSHAETGITSRTAEHPVVTAVVVAFACVGVFLAALRHGWIHEADINDRRLEVRDKLRRGRVVLRAWLGKWAPKRIGAYGRLQQHDSALLELASTDSADKSGAGTDTVVHTDTGTSTQPGAETTSAAPQMHSEL